MISPKQRSSGAPFAITAPWPRYVHSIVSVGRSARDAPNDHGLLPLAEMGRAADETLREQPLTLLLEEADLIHHPQAIELILDSRSAAPISRSPGERASFRPP